MTKKEWRAEALKQYFHYFRFWFIGLGVLLILFLGVWAVSLQNTFSRGNDSAPAERVFDYAGVLEPQEEEKLRKLIARTEERIGCDLVLVTTCEQIGEDPDVRELRLRDMADDFYDENLYGFDCVHGNGALLMDNWYEGQMSTWLSTCGSVYQRLDSRDIDDVLDEVYRYISYDPYRAYRAYIEEMENKMSGRGRFAFPPLLILVVPVVAMAAFVFLHRSSALEKGGTAPNTYVAGGRPHMRARTDQLARKYVTQRRIPRPDGGSSGGGHRGGGGGGGHVSSGGVSHGGGGRSR